MLAEKGNATLEDENNAYAGKNDDHISRTEIEEEIDVPLNFTDRDLDTTDALELKEIEVAEKDKDRKEKRYFNAFRLIVGCLVLLAVIYIVEVIDAALLNQSLSSMTSEVVEIIKTLLFTLSGYLFARKESGD